MPNKHGVKPGWGARSFPKQRAEQLLVLADGREGADGSALPLYADGAVLAGTIKAGQTIRQTLGAGRVGYLVAATGSVSINGVKAGTRDGVTITDEQEVVITADADSEVVLVDVAA
jgi:redox-sensitive bicupin YhaK (pirin superfamily)